MRLLTLSCVYAVFILCLLVLCKVYAVVTLGRCRSKRKLNGKTALVTGSNRGIGYYTALDLARRGARVIIASEDEEGCNRAKDKIVHETGNKNIVVKFIDLRSLDNVRKFAKDILDTEDRLDILVNNAGTTGKGRKLTKDGLHPVMQINYFSQFLLTHLLLDLLKRSGPARIVNVASFLSQFRLGFYPDDLNVVQAPFNDAFYELCAYSNSKACVALSTIELAEKLKGTNVTVNCLHPGAVYTQIFSEIKTGWFDFVTSIVGTLYYKTPVEGAETSIHLAVCESVEGVSGKYFSDCRESWLWFDSSKKLRQNVWDQTVKLLKLKSAEMKYD